MTTIPRVYTPIDATKHMPGTPVHRWLTHLDEICHQAHLDLVAAPLSLALLDATLRAWAANKTHHNEIARVVDLGLPVTTALYCPIPVAVTRAVPDEVRSLTLDRLTGYGWLDRRTVAGESRWRARIGQPYGEPR